MGRRPKSVLSFVLHCFIHLGASRQTTPTSDVARRLTEGLIFVVLILVSALGASRVTKVVEAACSSSIAYGDNVDCSISSSGEVDTFTFSGESGDVLYVRMGETASSSLRPRVEVWRPDSTILCSNTAANTTPTATASALCTLDDTGTFTVKAKDNATGTGNYGLYIQRVDDPVGATAISFGDNATGTLAAAEVTEYSFSATSGDIAFLRMAKTQNQSYTPQLKVFRPNGTVLCEGDSSDEQILTCTADTTGTHLVLASTKYNQSGGFGVYIQRLNGPSGTTSISYGSSTSGSLASAEVIDYAFDGTSGERLYARLYGTGAQAQQISLRIYKPDGASMCSGTGADSPPAVDFDCTLTSTGSYLVLVSYPRGYPAASSLLYLQRTSSPVSTTSVSYGDNSAGTIQTGEVADYSFSGASGDVIYARMGEAIHNGFGWTRIRVYKPDGTLLCQSNSSWSVEAGCTLASTGTHLLLAYADGGSGDFTVYVQKANGPTGATNVTYGQTSLQSIASSGGVADFAFSGTSGERIYARLAQSTSSGLDAHFKIFRPDGTQLCNGWNSSSFADKDCVLDATGTYLVLGMDYYGAWGPAEFGFYLQRTSNPVTVNQTWYQNIYLGYLNPAAVDAYYIAIAAADVANFKMSEGSASVSPRFRVYFPDGTFACSEFSATIAEKNCGTLTTSGSYLVLAMDNYGHGTGDYSLYISQVLANPPVFDPEHPSSDGKGDSETPDPINIASGDLTHEHTDLTIPGKGIPIEFTRYYHAGSTANRSLGHRWTHTYDTYLAIESNEVTIFYPNGSASAFVLAQGSFAARPGITDSLVQNGDGTYTLTTARAVKYNFSSAGKLTSILDRNGYATTVSYDGNGRISTVTDPGSRSLTFTVDSGTGLITQVTDPLSRTVEFAYDGNGDLTEVTNVGGGITEYAYSSHRLTAITDANEHVAVQNVFDSAGRAVEQTDAVSGKTCLYYGRAPSYTSTGCPGVSPAPTSTQTVVVDPRGKKTTYTFDSLWRTSQVKNHDGGIITYAYDADNNVSCVTDPLNHRTAYTYDSNGNLTSMIDANNTSSSCGLATGGVQWSYTYTSYNDVDLETNPRGNKTDYVYDANGNLIEVQRKDSGNNIQIRTCLTVPTSGTNKGLVTERIESTTLSDCTGNKTKLEYDSKGNLTAIIDPRFSSQGTPPKTTMTYDDGGRRLTVTNELDHTTTWAYDDQNHVVSVEDELGNKTTFAYDAKGNPKTVVDANREILGTAESGSNCGSAGTGDGLDNDSDTVIDDGCPNIIYSYDDADRLTAVIDAIGKTTTYGYDANGNRISVTNANRQTIGTAESGSSCGTSGTGNDTDDDSDGTKDDGCPSTLYTYDNLNRLASEKDALGHAWSYAHDAASRLITRTDPKSQQTSYSYNNRNDLTSIDYPAGTTDVSFQYDGVRNRTQMTDATGTSTYSFDAANRLSSVTFPGSRTVSYSYSNSGNRSSMTYAGGSNQVSYGHDAANHLTSVTDWNSNLTEYGYDDAGMLTTTTLPNGVVGTYTYNSADRLEEISWEKDSSVLAFVEYTLDAVGNRTQRVDGLGTHYYEYDRLYRITTADYPGTDETDYTYDALGNRSTMVTGAGTTTYDYDAAGRLTSVTPPGQGATSYGSDNSGNLTSRGSDTFTWNAENRLVSATVNSVTTTFIYTGDGIRDSLTVNSSTTTFTWDVNRKIPEVLDDEDSLYVYGVNRVAQVQGSTSFYFLSDGLGSTMALTDADGDLVNDYEFDVFGGIRDSSGSQGNDFKFTGEQEDDSTALHYLRARYYDAATGRFISRDPISGVMGLPSSQNRYAYVLNNPANLLDPYGLCVGWGVPCPKPIKRAKDWVEDRVNDADAVWDHGIQITNAGLLNQLLAGSIAALSSCDRREKEGGIVVYTNCNGLAGTITKDLFGGQTFTLGSFIFSPIEPDPSLMRHELAHVEQYDILGGAFLPVYAIFEVPALIGCGGDPTCAHAAHPFEILADFRAGTNER